ncbi:MAG: 3-dehydroquinate synthase, partial [Proteobacteria bacterium]|nr:3-dehydroquinate synthase [Pseudomonadota bacterium]
RGELVATELVRDRRVVLLSERRVAGLHLDRYWQALGRPNEMIVAPGERSKSLTSARRIYEALLTAGVERRDLLVAVGGGMITDLGAFVAATYKRGLDFILASTSLVGCVDAAIGGKAGVNLGRSKNMVGCFTAPRAVILDVTALSTLPRRQIAEGLVEAYKTGLVADPGLAELVETRIKELLAGDLEALARVAVMSAKAKADVVGIDFKEGGLRSILNLGHTYGHAVEGHHRFRVSHGRAVAQGILVAAELSLGRGLIDPEQARRIGQTLAPLLPGGLTPPTPDEAWALMRNDKKNRGGRIRFVLLEGPGRARLADDVTRDELATAVARLEVERNGS